MGKLDWDWIYVFSPELALWAGLGLCCAGILWLGGGFIMINRKGKMEHQWGKRFIP